MESQSNEPKKSGRGGARAGAGRKRKENGRNISVALSLSTKAYENLLRLVEEQGSNKNDVINKILEELN